MGRFLACEKIPFSSERAAKESRGRKMNKGHRMRAYLCDCGYWHLTTQVRPRREV